MKVFLLIFSLFFLISATNDCCLVELEEELSKISKTTHSETDHSEESEACEDCKCGTFCSYNLITKVSDRVVSVPSSYSLQINFHTQSAKEKNLPDSIFHPPIV